MSCDIVRGITKPTFIWDSFVEEKKMLNGKIKIGFGLLDTCERYNIKGIMSEAHKTLWRDTIINNYPSYSDEEKKGILEYNLEDVLTNKLI